MPKRPIAKNTKKKSQPSKKRTPSHRHRLAHLAATASHCNHAAALKAQEAMHYAEAAKHYMESTKTPSDSAAHLATAERHTSDARLAAERAIGVNDIKYKMV